MRKPAPCMKCESSGTVHKRCENYEAWKVNDLEVKKRINNEKYKHKECESFRHDVFKRR